MANDGRPLVLIVPGLDNSGPDHWQSLWQARRGDCRRVDLGCWSEPDRRIWTERLDAALAMTDGPLVLVAHSLGCLTIAWWALGADHARLERVRGALLVAPPDVDSGEAHPFVRRFAPAPNRALPFRSILVASRDDRYAAFCRLEDLARAWGSRFVDAGHAGHINARSGLGYWDDGEALLEELIDENARAPAASRKKLAM
jgi:predicted alpha/beta hydrolase family esterase